MFRFFNRPENHRNNFSETDANLDASYLSL